MSIHNKVRVTRDTISTPRNVLPLHLFDLLAFHPELSFRAPLPKPIVRLAEMLPQRRPVWTILGTVLEPLKLVDEVRLMTNIVVTARPLLSPPLQRVPVPALAQLAHRALGALGDGGVARGIVSLAEDVPAQAVEAVCDVHEGEGLRQALLILTHGAVDVLEAVQGVEAVEDVQTLAVVPREGLRGEQVMSGGPVVVESHEAHVERDAVPELAGRGHVGVCILGGPLEGDF